jgi:hypothetical protein
VSVEALAAVLHHSRARGTDKLVLVGIANHDGDGGAWPGVGKLACYANVDERTVRRSLRRLETLGEIRVHLQAGGPSGVPEWKRPNRYDVLVACPATCDRTRHHHPIPLPQAPADLWIDRGTPTSPPDAHVPTPGTPTSPPPGTPTSPEPSLEPTSTTRGAQEPQLQTAGTRTRERVCSECLLPESECTRRTAVSGHEFKSSSYEEAAS